ncbi:MAG: phosphoglycerate mutase family protein [Flavisolibacter sp.]
MYRLIFLAAALIFISCRTRTYFVVRHAEKASVATMTNDVPLSAAGKQRSEALRDQLRHRHIRWIYATNFQRTRSTAQPLADAEHLRILLYDPRDTSFVNRVKKQGRGNVLIVGHSNTVDDLVNQLEGKRVLEGDLPEGAYGDLFVIKEKGGRYRFEKKHFGL